MVENNQRNNKLCSTHILVSIKKILLVYSHAHLFASCLVSMPAFISTELKKGNRDHLPREVKNIYYLAFYGKSLQTPDLKALLEVRP